MIPAIIGTTLKARWFPYVAIATVVVITTVSGYSYMKGYQKAELKGKEKEIEALVLITTLDNWRRISHMISDKVYERLTGERGYFDTRIIYVAEEGPKTQRKKRLAIMDQDGANNKFLTLGNELVLTPRFNPTSQMVTYLSYFKNLPRVYLLDIETGLQEVVGDFPGMTFAPRFSPDGKKIIMSFAKDGKSDIYTMDLENRIVERITNHPSIDTSPSYSPNGKFIAFNSDRSGLQQIYVMRSDGGGVKRITFGNGIYGTPAVGKSGLITFGLNNTLEAKKRVQSDSGFVNKKISLIENFGISFFTT